MTLLNLPRFLVPVFLGVITIAAMVYCTIFRASAAPQPAQVIDGAVNPEMIPDWRAYSIFFRFISDRSGRESVAIRGYLKQLRLGSQNCVICSVSSPESQLQI